MASPMYGAPPAHTHVASKTVLITRDELKRQERNGTAAALKQTGGRNLRTRRCRRIARHEANNFGFAHQGSEAQSKDWVMRISFFARLAASEVSGKEDGEGVTLGRTSTLP